MNKHTLITLTCLGALGLGACSGARDNTLAELDVARDLPEIKEEALFATEQQTAEALREYLKSASKNDKARRQAITRLAELEIQASIESAARGTLSDEAQEAADARQLEKSIRLYQSALADYPDNPDNDRVLYQLAKAYGSLGQQERAVETLQQLVESYPQSQHYTDSQFRLGEVYFGGGKYIRSEDAYTEVLTGTHTTTYSTRALYKRGWARFKQELYYEALDDFYGVLSAYEEEMQISAQALSVADREVFDDCLRAISLSFSYLGGFNAVKEYFDQEEGSDHIKYAYQALGDLYLRQERHADAAGIYQAYTDQYADSGYAPELMLRTIESWKQSRYEDELIESRKAFEKRYGLKSAYWSTHDIDKAPKIRAAGKENIRQLAAYYHGRYQKEKREDDYRQAVQWYQHYEDSYPDEKDGARTLFLYGELLSERRRLEAAVEKYKSAIALYEGAEEGAEALYALISATNTLAEQSSGEEKRKWLAMNVEYSSLFSQSYTGDKRASDTLLNAAGKLFEEGRFEEAIRIAQSTPESASKDQRAQALLMAGHGHYRLEQYEKAEQYYADALKLEAVTDKEKSGIEERLAASIYYQGEQARKAGDLGRAADLFLKVRATGPATTIAPTAMLDAAATYITLKNWNEAVSVLTDLRKAYPQHELQGEVTKKLAVAYMNNGQSTLAAREFEAVAGIDKSPQIQGSALLQAAQLYEEAGQNEAAISAYRRYVKDFAQPFAQAMEARYKLVELYGKQGDTRNQNDWRRQIIREQKKAKTQGNERTRVLASQAAKELADIQYTKFQGIELKLPLAKNLRLKKQAMNDAVKAYTEAASFGVTDTIAYSTLKIGDIYQAFSVSLIESERPKDLTPEQRDEYDVLLEDQAYPFEEKAIKFYEVNAGRIKKGIYNDAIDQSLARLSTLYPARYNRKEKTEAFIDAVE